MQFGGMQHFEVVGGMQNSWLAWGEAVMDELEKQKQRLNVVEKAMSPPPKFTWRSSRVRRFPIHIVPSVARCQLSEAQPGSSRLLEFLGATRASD